MNYDVQEGSALHVRWVSLVHYRRFAHLQFNPSGFNVVVGINGSGKSALLRGLSLALSRLTSRIENGRAGGLRFDPNDVHTGQNYAYAEIGVQKQSRLYAHGLAYNRRGRSAAIKKLDAALSDAANEVYNRQQSFTQLADDYRDRLAENAGASLPVIALYPVNRAVLDIPMRIKGKHTFDQVTVYDGAFETQRSFRNFFMWFREMEDLENETRIDHPRHRDPQLQAVRKAIQNFMEDYRDLRVRRNPLRMTLKKLGEELLVDQLSDGEKALLSLVGDLARRMAIANPGLENPLEGEGVVMIDEVDLHLHPSWQRKVVQRLPETFPNVQFFLTTHSPVVASAVRPESLWVLRDGEIKHAEAYGQDVGLVLSEVFDTPPRLDVVRRELDDLFVAIHERNLPDAAERLRHLEELIGPSDPELVQARVMMQGYAVV